MKQKRTFDPLYKNIDMKPDSIDIRFKDKDSLIGELTFASKKDRIKPA